MKNYFIPILLIAIVLVTACRNSPKVVTENPYVGAWEKTYSKYIYPDSTYETTQYADPTVKLLTLKHYAFGNQDEEYKISGGGGEYSYNGDIFISYPKYHTSSSLVGDSLVMKSKIEGDLWTISFSIEIDTIKIDATEIWKRIME